MGSIILCSRLISRYCYLSIILLLPFLSEEVFAKGIALGATRVIYQQGVKQTSLSIINSSLTSRYLVQSWIEDSNGKKSSDFIITPPIFLSKVKSENALRIMYIGKSLPSDRESVFWINSKAIPEVDSDNINGKNVLQLAILSRIKLFFRPNNISLPSEDAPKALRFEQKGNILKIKNSTPYFITLVKLTVADKKIPNVMVSPLNTTEVKLPSGINGTIRFSTINDYGAETPSQEGFKG